MEVDGRDPIFVTLSSHDVFAAIHVPDLPGAVVRGGRHNLLPHVEGHSADSLGVGIDTAGSTHPGGHSFVGFAQEGVGTSVLRIRCILLNASAER